MTVAGRSITFSIVHFKDFGWLRSSAIILRYICIEYYVLSSDSRNIAKVSDKYCYLHYCLSIMIKSVINTWDVWHGCLADALQGQFVNTIGNFSMNFRRKIGRAKIWRCVYPVNILN